MSGPLPRLLVLWAVLVGTPEVGGSQDAARGTTGEIAGRVLRPDGLPQPDAEVVLAQRAPSGGLRQLTRWRARTGFDGRYAITGVTPGRYLVLVRPIGSDVAVAGRPAATLFPHVPVNEAGTLVEVVAGLSTEGIDVWMVPSPRRFTITGRVFGPEGSTFDSLVLETGRPGARATDVWTSTEPGGLFTIDPAPAGTLVIKARATIGDRVLTGLAATTVAANPIEDVRITVRPLVEVSGRIRVTPPALLPAGLSISLVTQAIEPTPLYPAAESPVDAEGRFRVAADAAPLRIVVRGLPDGWRAVRPGGSLDVGMPPSEGPLDLLLAGPSAR
jgi:hypothetical protein